MTPKVIALEATTEEMHEGDPESFRRPAEFIAKL
jgi:hypothetical protein